MDKRRYPDLMLNPERLAMLRDTGSSTALVHGLKGGETTEVGAGSAAPDIPMTHIVVMCASPFHKAGAMRDRLAFLMHRGQSTAASQVRARSSRKLEDSIGRQPSVSRVRSLDAGTFIFTIRSIQPK